MVDIGKIHRRTLVDGAAVWCLLAGEHFKECGLARTVAANDANDGAARNNGAEIVDQEPVAKALTQIIDLNNLFAQTLACWNKQLRGLATHFTFLRDQFIKTSHTRLTFGLPRLGVGAHPFQL